MRSEYVSTLRTFLDRSGFDWVTGKIIIKTSRWPRRIDSDDLILDTEFLYSGINVYGDLPNYIAEDKDAIYFPYKDEWGITYPMKVSKTLEDYLDISRVETDLPFPGKWRF